VSSRSPFFFLSCCWFLCKPIWKQESRCIAKGRKVGVDTPCLYLVDTEKSRIYMEEIIGLTVKEFIYRATANNTGLNNQLVELPLTN